jgi:hypothetical protein
MYEIFSKIIPLPASFRRYWENRRVAGQVRNGQIPKGVSPEDIFQALKATRPRGAVELFGFLYAKVFDKHGNLKQDLGLQGVREVTAAFADHLVDCLTTSGDAIEDFKYHGMGAGSTAETDSQTALVDEKGVKGTGSQTHGASSEIYRSVKTMTATTTFGCREHGVFNTLTGGVMLDRTVVTNIALDTDDEVEWTYELTINAGG